MAWRKARVRAVGLVLSAAAFCSAGVSSCGAGGSSVKSTGTTLTIYLSQPPGEPASARDVISAEQLAFRQLGGSSLGKYRLRLVTLAGPELSDNARGAIQNTGAVAYLGEIAPGASAQSLGITNAQDLLQVSPTDTALELTQSTPAISNTPNRYYESLKTYGRTFARVVPSTAVEANKQVDEMHSLGVSKLYVTGDGSPYGLALAAEVKKAAAGQGITIASAAAQADAVFYAGASVTGAAHVFQSAASANAQVKLFGPSALNDPGLPASLGGAARNLYISLPSAPAGPEASKFASDFKLAFRHAPASEAIFGYGAMQAVLFALRQAGSSVNDRAKVVDAFFAIRNNVPSSVLGAYSINSNGDTSLGSFVWGRVKHGAIVPVK